MKARQAKKILTQMIQGIVTVKTIPRGGAALVLKVPRQCRRQDIKPLIDTLAERSDMDVVVLPEGFDLEVIAREAS